MHTHDEPDGQDHGRQGRPDLSGAKDAAPSAPSQSTLVDCFEPFGLSITADDVTLRLLRDTDLPAYAALLRRPVFEDPTSDLVFPWYAVDADERVRNAVQFQWRLRAELSPEDWTLSFGVFRDGALIGMQDVAAKHFAVRRTVNTGSWLTLDEHGKGIGKLMRQAVLVVAFDHLGAERAETSAVVGNVRSYGVSRGAGYADNGLEVIEENGARKMMQRFMVTPERLRRPAVDVQVHGLTPALRARLGAPLLG